MPLGEPLIRASVLDATLPEGAVAVADDEETLICSVLLRPPRRASTELSLVGAVAVADALERLVRLAIQIKWPGDVMLRRDRVAAAAAAVHDGVVTLAIRVNVGQSRDDLAAGAGSLRTSTGRTWDHGDVLTAALGALGRRYDEWLAGGIDALYDGLGPRDFLRGRRVRVDGTSGTALMIDRGGRLLVDAGSDVISLARGEVSHDR